MDNRSKTSRSPAGVVVRFPAVEAARSREELRQVAKRLVDAALMNKSTK